ncbi:cation:proton antiporter domain-containing protein [Rosettibacter firmus]|uniref:cation:proton antiporter domain-containing protein n=1 Tax=Rosettibacter firmus TaxID=3111522 RepID=UPI00336BFA96
MSSNEITIFLVSISIILLFARGFGELLRLIKQPIVIGEIIAGIFLGPTIFGKIFPESYNLLFHQSQTVSIALHGLTTLGVVMLLLITGIEIDISLMIKQGKKPFLISLFGVLFPFLIGFFASYFFPKNFGLINSEMHLIYSLFIGTALSVTALPVVARTLMELNIFKSEIGSSIITAAMLIDLIGWLIFSVLLGIIGKTHSQNFEVYEIIVYLIFFALAVFFLFRKLFDYILGFSNKYLSNPGGLLNIIFILGFLGAAFTEYIGIHAIFGAFIVGIAIGDSGYLKENIREILNQFITNIFAPLFFVTVGLKINFIDNFDLLLVIMFISLSIAGKITGAFLGGYLSGFNKNDSFIIAFGLNAHGTIELILGTIAYESGLINEKVFVALIIMAIVTTLSSAPLMSLFIKKAQTIIKLSNLIKPENIIFTDINDKEELIKILCKNISQYNGIDFQNLFKRVLEREKLISTGLENSIAIPHARLKIKKPLAAIAIHKQGLDFDSIDKLPAKIIILLITPEDNPEIQLELISEIAMKFGNKKVVEDLVSAKDSKDVIYKIKQLY